MKKRIIIVTGTPGTGKTSIAKALAQRLRWTYLDVNTLIRKAKLAEQYDAKRKTWVVDEKKLAKFLISYINTKKKNLVIDSHMSHLLPASLVEQCIVTKCTLPALKQRLRGRGYSAQKVRENLDAEIFDVCLNEAYERNHHVLVVDTTKKSPQELVNSFLF